jgi:hypothetical protein
MTPRRNYQFLHSFKTEPDTTFLYLGVPVDAYNPVPQELIEVFDRLSESGGRLVLSFLAVIQKQADNDNRDKEPESSKTKNTECRGKPKKKGLTSVNNHWGIGLEFNQNLAVKDGSYLILDAVSNRRDLPPVISWHSNLYFDLIDQSWQVLYRSEGHPVIVERPFGKGSLVLCADSFFISNEALQSERQPQLLLRILGRHSKIIFDEAHFGIHRQPSVAVLLRRYRFQWFFLVLVVMALLFVWKNTVYFVTPRKDGAPTGADVVSDKDYTRGLISLLRRNIPRSEILQICGQEWERTFGKNKRIQPETFDRVKKILRTQALYPKKDKVDVVNGYRKLSRIIQRTKEYE